MIVDNGDGTFSIKMPPPWQKEKSLNDAIKIIEQLKIDTDMIYKEYENTYEDGWLDAFNEILSALYKELDGKNV